MGREQVCKSGDMRLAPASLVGDIVSDPRFLPGRVGLRLIGGIYCGELVLREIIAKYSIVIDHSILFGGGLVRNIGIDGDLSLDKTQVDGPLLIRRSRIEGGLFAREAVIQSLGIYDSVVGRSMQLSGSAFPGTKNKPADMTLEIDRTKVGGELLLENAFVGHFLMQNDEVGATLGLKNSTFLESARIEHTSVSGAFGAQKSDFAFALIRDGKFSSTVDFHETEFRCTLIASKNFIGGDFNLVESGLGRTAGVVSATGDHGLPSRSWSMEHETRARERPPRGIANANIEPDRLVQIDALFKSHPCKFEAYIPPHEIRLTDNKIEKNLCVKSIRFERLITSPESNASAATEEFLPSHLSLAGSTVGGNTILSLWPGQRRIQPSKGGVAAKANEDEPLYFKFAEHWAGSSAEQRSARARVEANQQEQREARMCPAKHCIELLGLHSGGLVIDTGDNKQTFGMFTTGMKFDRIFRGNVNCPYPRTRSTVETEGQMFLPSPIDVILWLEKADSTQPLAAAIDAFERAGSDATELKIRKAELEWGAKYRERKHDFFPVSSFVARFGEIRNRDGLWSSSVWAFTNALDLIHLGATRTLGFLADYGYRPAKALLWVVSIIIFYKTTLWFALGIVAFRSAESDTIRPIGLIFLFDRLIPLYHIREANYAIKEFYKWNCSLSRFLRTQVLRRLIRSTDFGDGLAPPQWTRHFGVRIAVTKASSAEARRVEALLDLLKMIGAILAVFLVAAINTLVAR